MGSYAGGYVKAFQNKEPYGQNLETEMYAGLTDLRYEKGDGKGISVASWKAYRELAKTYPDFIKTFEILSDKPIGDDYVEPVFDEDERKSFGESLVINDFEVETWEEVGLDDSRNKVDFSDATLIMNKGYNKIGKLVLVETYLPESVKAEEEFVEEEHPRDEDGKFTSKWEISTFVGGHEIPVTQREKDNWEKHTTEEQRKDSNFKTMYGDKLKEKARGKGWDESEDVKVEKEDVEKEDVEKEIVEPQPPEERPQGDNYRIKAMKNKLKKHLEVLEDGKQILKDKYGDSPNLESALQKMDIAIKQLKKEIDDVDTKKYRTELPNIPMGKNTHTNETDGFVYNKTKIKIDRKLEENMGLRQQLAVIQSAWNDLPDDVRDVVKILNLKMSRARGRTIQGGMYNDKKQEVVLNINERSTNTVHNFYHEIGHARWHDMERKQPEKIKKFEEQVRKINKAPTKYAESYKNAVDRENKFREKWSQKMKRSGQDEWDPERYAKNMKILDARANAVKNIFQNEIHSELNAYAMGEIEDEMIISGKDTLKSLLNAYKDLWGIGN